MSHSVIHPLPLSSKISHSWIADVAARVPHPSIGAAFSPVPGFGSRAGGGQARRNLECMRRRRTRRGPCQRCGKPPGGIPGMKGVVSMRRLGNHAVSVQAAQIRGGPPRADGGSGSGWDRHSARQALPISPRAAKAKPLIQRRRGLPGHMIAVSLVLTTLRTPPAPSACGPPATTQAGEDTPIW